MIIPTHCKKLLIDMNLKKLQSIARRRLDLKGAVEFKTVPSRRAMQLKLGAGFLTTSTNVASTKHMITYSDIASLEPADVYHELCRAKFNELGFTTIESASLNAIRDCCKDD